MLVSPMAKHFVYAKQVDQLLGSPGVLLFYEQRKIADKISGAARRGSEVNIALARYSCNMAAMKIDHSDQCAP